METRFQEIDGKATLEITETVVQKTHYTEARLLEQKAYFEEMIAKDQAGLADVEAKLTLINDERAKLAG